MAATDHLGQQFTELYHGTSLASAVSIRRSGLTSSAYRSDNPTLTSDRSEAERYARSHAFGDPASPGLVTVRVPHEQSGHYLQPATTYHEGNGSYYALRQPLPRAMVHDAEAI